MTDPTNPEEFWASLTPDEQAETIETVRRQRAEAAAEAAREERRLAARRLAAATVEDADLTQGLGVHVVFRERDLTEGRGGTVASGMFLFPEDAGLAQRLLEGVMGVENSCRTQVQTVYFSLDDWLDNGGAELCNKERLRAWREDGVRPISWQERHDRPGGWSGRA
jgi:hypothetical protein